MLAGAGKARIDLEGVLPFDGFDIVRDDLHVRSIVFQNPDGTRSCLISVDATSMRDDAPLRSAAAAVVRCREETVWVSVTHTFSVPHVRTPEHLATDEERARNVLLAERLVAAVRAACAASMEELAPVQFEVARGRCSVNANRDVQTPEGWWLGIDPNGFSDRSVRVMRLVSLDHLRRTVATIYTVDVQSSMVQGIRDAEGRALASADLAGETSRLLEERLGGVAVFMVGAAGDQTPRVKGAGALPELGRILSAEVTAALTYAERLSVSSVELSQLTVTCPAQRRADFHSLAPTRSYAFVPEGAVDTLVSVARLGRLTVAGLQPEVDSAFGARLREAGEGCLEVLTMVNGAQKYLPSAEAYDRITYEAMNSGFARGADEVLATAILNLVKE
ncbi:MAG: hypothetical protein IJ781_06350 [Atopobiaceae bacterium]|nr:hypothetical protein [Atopobiaceae bacterium]